MKRFGCDTHHHLVRGPDVAALLRLVGEVNELPPDDRLRRTHILQALCQICEADKGVYVQLDLCDEKKIWTIRPAHTIFHQTPLGELRKVDFFYSQQHPRDPVLDAMAAERERVMVATPRDLFTQEEWERNEHFNEVRRPSQISEQLYSQLHSGSRSHGIGLHRRDRRPFTDREKQIIMLFLSNSGHLLGPLHESAVKSRELPPRFQPVLECLLAGDSEKEAARRLKLTQNTIHTYIKHIYRALEVNSRAELMARFVSREPISRMIVRAQTAEAG